MENGNYRGFSLSLIYSVRDRKFYKRRIMNDMLANNLALVQSDPAFKSAFLLAVGSRAAKRANSVGRESWSICNELTSADLRGIDTSNEW